MKVKFDLKYRQQIESGEYKVETVDGRQVRIICWDAHNPYRENDIVALATSSSGEGENILRYYSNGHLISDSANIGNKDLIVLIPDEDERIRKTLIEALKTSKTVGELKFIFPESTREECIAYLEKQGEQKVSVDDFKAKDWYVSKVDGKIHNIYYSVDKVKPKFKVGDKIIEKDFDECGRGTIIDIKDGKYIFDDGGFICIEEQGLWKLVEQKPAEWSEDKYPKNIETDAVMFCFDNGFNITPYQARTIAKHFYELGFKRIGDGKA